MTDPGSLLRADVMRPSALGAAERAAWQRIQLASPSLQRAFLTPSFALACERAHGRAYVAVMHGGGTILGFFPFQFRSVWHQHLRMAERVGGGLSDAAGLIAEADLRIGSDALLRLARLSSLAVTHLMPGQEQFGLAAKWSQVGHVTDLSGGTESYFAALLRRDKGLVRDTERQLRKAEAEHGTLRLIRDDGVAGAQLSGLIEQKREQYRRTQVADPFASYQNLRLISVLNEVRETECRLVMHRLLAGEQVLAQHLGPQHHDVLSYWFPVYDNGLRSVSPGRLLLWRMIESATDHGIRLIDYGEGDALYKRKFATETIHLGRADWSRGDARSAVARVYQGLEWRLREKSRRRRRLAQG